MSRKIAVSWIELTLLALLVVSGMGIGLAVEQAIGQQLRGQEPKADQFQQAEKLPGKQAELLKAQGELKSLQDKLVEQRFELRKQSTRMQTLSAAFPLLAKLAYGAPAPRTGVPREAFNAYQTARMEAQAGERLVKELSTEVDQAIQQVSDRTAALTAAQQAAIEKHEAAHEAFVVKKKWQILKWSAAAVAVFLISARLLVAIAVWLGGTLAAGKTTAAWNPTFTFLLAAAILSVLLGYQAFQLIGAAASGMVLALLLFFILTSRSVPQTAAAEQST
jgi:hypothetical protein